MAIVLDQWLCDLNSPFKPRWTRDKKTATREFINATSTASRLDSVSRYLLYSFDLTATKVSVVWIVGEHYYPSYPRDCMSRSRRKIFPRNEELCDRNYAIQRKLTTFVLNFSQLWVTFSDCHMITRFDIFWVLLLPLFFYLQYCNWECAFIKCIILILHSKCVDLNKLSI